MPSIPGGQPDQDFDPDAPGGGDGLFGLPPHEGVPRCQIIPVPWEATASYGRGTRTAPAAILQASVQVDLHDLEYGAFWTEGIILRPPHPALEAWSDAVEEDAQAVIASEGTEPARAARVDAVADEVHAWVYAEANAILDAGAIPAVLGGDHSSPYGLLRAVSERHPGVGVLHIDAHADLRDAYLGFRWSHASIFHNALQLPGIARHVGLAWRDIGARELARVAAEAGRIVAFTDVDLARAEAEGETWAQTCDRVIAALPPKVYVSFDIDGLDPALCPHTGTPVPGGLSWRQLHILLAKLSAARAVVGFDLCEVSPGPAGLDAEDEWDANVGARALFKLAGCALRSRPVGA
ncbi:MAG: agmatinase [Pseudomonadota bacterium]|jgi:agmatinase